MSHPNDRPTVSTVFTFGVLAAMTLAGCGSAQADNAGVAELFPKDYHPLIPMLPRNETQVATGAVTGEAPPQPVAFPHDRHVQLSGIQCEYCHSAARNSVHAGVPELQACMGCHQLVMRDSPEIKLIAEYWKRKEPLPWNRVHDLPDFVSFSHMRHVRAGVDCTECHGQIQLMAGRREPPPGQAASAPDVAPIQTAYDAAVQLGAVKDTMKRESSLQMGWCVECHETHSSVDKNYGDKANLRRAELKDCWTCHK